MIICGYVLVVLMTAVAPDTIIGIAYDSGGVTTSTVTVPGRSPLLDGFGLVAFASLFPIICVLGYAQITALRETAPRERRPNEVSVATADPVDGGGPPRED